MHPQSPNLFKTDSFRIAIVLKASKIPLHGLNKENPHKAIFLFADSPQIHKLLEEYYQGTMRLDPREVFNSQDELRELLYGNYLTHHNNLSKEDNG
jgi:hypothetical protein